MQVCKELIKMAEIDREMDKIAEYYIEIKDDEVKSCLYEDFSRLNKTFKSLDKSESVVMEKRYWRKHYEEFSEIMNGKGLPHDFINF